ncbi:MAG: hypothetical protein R2771_12935 [Saprospiraceae bacterium]
MGSAIGLAISNNGNFISSKQNNEISEPVFEDSKFLNEENSTVSTEMKI